MASEVKEDNNSTPSAVKDDDGASDCKKTDNEMKDDDKDSLKNESKEESSKDASDDDEDEDDDDDDEEVALLDRPVEVTGCRARKKVERLEVSFSTPKENKKELPEGKGTKLGDCPRIEAQIQKLKAVDLKPLHKILFGRTGSANEIKKNLRKFSGFPFEKDSLEFNRRKASVEKLSASVLKEVCSVLDLERGKTKEDIVNRIMSFLLKPADSGKKVPSKKKVPKEKKKKTTSKKVKSEKKAKSDESEDEPEESDEEDDDSTGGEASMGGTDEEVEGSLPSDDEPKKKSKETKSSKGKGKKEEKKPKSSKRKQDYSSESSDDEPPAKKSKMPSDDEISKLVKQILASADLQEITMKKVIKQVSDAYPDFDLSHKKAFIKSTIKSVIS